MSQSNTRTGQFKFPAWKFPAWLSLVIFILTASCPLYAQTISWQGYTWTIKSGSGLGPGPNKWNPANCFVDANGYLHLLITADSSSPNGWDCAELSTTNALGFGTYQWQIESALDAFDPWVVLGLFPYLGPDGNNEIDIEYSRWSHAANSNDWWTVYPDSGKKIGQKAYNFSLSGTYTTSRFTWSSSGIHYWLMGGFQPVKTTTNVIHSWNYTPPTPSKNIPQNALPLHMNLWLFKGHAPTNGLPVEVIIHSFTKV
jgi:hypothetical protein